MKAYKKSLWWISLFAMFLCTVFVQIASQYQVLGFMLFFIAALVFVSESQSDKGGE